MNKLQKRKKKTDFNQALAQTSLGSHQEKECIPQVLLLNMIHSFLQGWTSLFKKLHINCIKELIINQMLLDELCNYRIIRKQNN